MDEMDEETGRMQAEADAEEREVIRREASSDARREEGDRIRRELLPAIQEIIWELAPSEADSIVEGIVDAFDHVLPANKTPESGR